MTTEPESTNSSSKATLPIKGVGTLRRRLLTVMLPTVLIPLLVASTIGNKITESRAKTQVINELDADTFLASKTVAAFIRESFKISDLVGTNPSVIQAMKAGYKQAEAENLAQQPIADIEKKFAATKLLSLDETLNNYLQEIVKSGQVAEIFFTERNGLNVAFSNPTSDFVQSDEGWWQTSQKEGLDIGEPEFDESANAIVIAFSRAVKEPKTGEFLGVIKAGISSDTLNADINSYLYGANKQDYRFQIINSQDGFIFDNIDPKNTDAENNLDIELIGGEPILQVAKTLAILAEDSLSLAEAQNLIAQQSGFSEVNVRQENILSQPSISASLKYQNKIYSLSTVPNTSLVSLGVVDYDVIAKEGESVLLVYGLTAIILGLVSVAVIVLLARQITQPLTNLSAITQKVAAGNLDIEANPEGTVETKTLANNFNNLVKQVKESLQNQQSIAEEQRQEKEQLEMAIYTLIEEVADATEGDLTVRANLDSLELSTVADLFNAIINNLQEIAVEAKQSTSLVGSSLKQNEAAIRLLAEQAIAEAQETRDTLMSVEQMSQSIQTVAQNANEAEKIADDTYQTIADSTSNMDLTVDSIVNLRTTVQETAKKMQLLGESSQKISQAVSFIEEIALKTNVLAINAGAEADRAGEYGRGFAIVAEQVGALAKQCTSATKEIAQIVGAIQAEAQEVNEAMESGTAQVVDSTRLVEATKQSLAMALAKSQTINQLMGSISQSTVSQASTSQNVTNLMQKIANLSETTSKSSTEVAQSIVETAQVAQKLESTVAQFKVAESS